MRTPSSFPMKNLAIEPSQHDMDDAMQALHTALDMFTNSVHLQFQNALRLHVLSNVSEHNPQVQTRMDEMIDVLLVDRILGEASKIRGEEYGGRRE